VRRFVDLLLDLYVRYMLKIEPDVEVMLSLLANMLIGICYGVAGCLLLWAAEV